MGSMERRGNTPQLLNRLRMRQVALLLAIDELGTLRAAAQQLGMTQPAGSKMLQELEDALGLALFARSAHGLQMLPAGRRVAEYFRHLRGSMEALNRELHELRQGSLGRLGVGSIMAATPGRLTQALLALKSQWPLLVVEVAVDTSDLLLEQLEQGVLEVLIGRPPPGTQAAPPPLSFCALEDEALCIVCACQHPLLGRGALAFADLQDYGWVLQAQGSPMRAVVEQEFADQRFALPRDLIETGSMLTTMSLVRNSERLAVLPEVVAAQHAAHGMVARVPWHMRRSLEAWGSLVRTDRPLSAPARAFLELLHGGGAQAAVSAPSTIG